MSKALKRVTYKEAMALLRMSRSKLDRIVGRDVFTVQADGPGKTAKRFFFEDELETYIEKNTDGDDGARAVLALRIEKRRKRTR